VHCVESAIRTQGFPRFSITPFDSQRRTPAQYQRDERSGTGDRVKRRRGAEEVRKVEVAMPAQGRADGEPPSATNADGKDASIAQVSYCLFLIPFLGVV
jgi:hypothetical protein